MRSAPLVIALALACAAPAFADDDDDTNAIDNTPHITIVGTARAEVAPDVAILSLGVTTQRPTAKAASEENAKTAQAVIAAAKAEGIGRADIATQSVGLDQLFDERPNGDSSARRPRGFEASNMITIRVRNLAQAGPLAQELIEKGADKFDGITFAIDHPEPILTRLNAEAVVNAKNLAQATADAAGVRLGRVLLIERPGTGGVAPMPMAAARVKASSIPVPVEAGTTELTAEMEVTWAIEPR